MTADMGYDCTCTLTLDGRTFQGAALLEQKELVFRGDLRLSIPLALVQDVHARDGRLLVSFGGRHAEFGLGDQAEKWAKRITSPASRLDKLGVRNGMRVAIVGAEDSVLRGEIEAQGASVEGEAGSTALDMVFFAAAQVSDLEQLPGLVTRLAQNGAIWLIRAKGRGAAVSERESMAAGKRAGLVDVKVVSYSDTHTAEKYVIPVASRPSRRRPRADRSR
jgi:hypothetical protein